MPENVEANDQYDPQVAVDEDLLVDEEKGASSLWLLIALGLLALLLIWILLGVWRYLQVLGHGTF